MKHVGIVCALAGAVLLAGCEGEPSRSTENGAPKAAVVRNVPKVVLTGTNTDVVVASDAINPVKFAGQRLTNYLARVFGCAVPIVTTPQAGRVAIVLGSNVWSQAAGLDVESLKRDGFCVRAESNRVFVAGRDVSFDLERAYRSGNPWTLRNEHGTMFGVYGFLERFAGCRFYFPGVGEVTPSAAKIEVPLGCCKEEPDAIVRQCSLGESDGVWPDGESGEKAPKGVKCEFRDMLRMATRGIPCCHGQNGFMCAKRFSKTHPEYFALLKDPATNTLRRDNDPEHKLGYHPNQICHTSAVWEEYYRDAKAYLTGQDAKTRGITGLRWNRDKYTWNYNCQWGKYVDVMAQDGMEKCLCANCKARYDETKKNYATELMWSNTVALANRLTREGVKGYVTQMAYTPYADVPKNCEIPGNVLVMVARTGPWSVVNPAAFAREIADYKAWYEKCGKRRIWLWTYPHKYGSTAIPGIPDYAPKAWGAYFKAAAPYSFGAFAESECDQTFFQAMNYYVFNKVLWNPKTDVDALLRECYALLFGAAAGEMTAFLEGLEEKWTKDVAGRIIDTPVGPVAQAPSMLELAERVYDPTVLAAWEKLLETAQRKAADDARALAAVKFFKRGLFDPLNRTIATYRAGISVEGEKARRAAHPERVNCIAAGKFSFYTPEGGRARWVKEGDEDVIACVSSNRVYLSHVFKPAGRALKTDTRYRISYFVKTENVKPLGRNGGVEADVDFRRGWFTPGAPITGTHDWIHQAYEIETGGDVTDKSYLCLRIINATGKAWFKGVEVTEVRP